MPNTSFMNGDVPSPVHASRIMRSVCRSLRSGRGRGIASQIPSSTISRLSERNTSTDNESPATKLQSDKCNTQSVRKS